jgi:hypothetical protein
MLVEAGGLDALLRFGSLSFVKATDKKPTSMRVQLDRLIAEPPPNKNHTAKAYLLSAIAGDIQSVAPPTYFWDSVSCSKGNERRQIREPGLDDHDAVDLSGCVGERMAENRNARFSNPR